MRVYYKGTVAVAGGPLTLHGRVGDAKHQTKLDKGARTNSACASTRSIPIVQEYCTLLLRMGLHGLSCCCLIA
jgi:hypothetical protein